VLFTLQVVFPYFGSEGISGQGFSVRFGYLGENLAEVMGNFWKDPFGITFGQIARRLPWIYYGIAPVLFLLPLRSLYAWAAVIPMLAVVVQDAAMSPMKLCAGPAFACAALISICPLLADRLRKHFGAGGTSRERASLCALALAVILICTNIALYRGWVYYKGPQMSDEQRRVVNRAVSMIPPDASVSAPDMICPRLAERKDLSPISYRRPAEWILSDEGGLRPGYPPQSAAPELLRQYGPYEKAFREGGITVWQRRRKEIRY
jgi:hypothetical protein